MNELTTELKQLLYDRGASLVGCADLSAVAHSHWKCGISIAMPFDANLIQEIVDGPNEAYFHAYHEMERKLSEIALEGEAFLLEQGYRAYAQTSQRVREDAQWRTELPHKTVATHAGLGWIGKSCLLVTAEYGSAVRLSSILTDAPLVCDTPILRTQCKGCRSCVDACPAGALTGISWEVGTDRDAMLRKEACADKQVELTRRNTGRTSEFLCGKCFAICPFTQRYIRSSRS